MTAPVDDHGGRFHFHFRFWFYLSAGEGLDVAGLAMLYYYK